VENSLFLTGGQRYAYSIENQYNSTKLFVSISTREGPKYRPGAVMSVHRMFEIFANFNIRANFKFIPSQPALL
jgi:hypothetical protein